VSAVKDSARYVKIVEWSDEDQCYVGSAPGLVYGGCHGMDERAVFAELCEIVDDAIELYKKDGQPLPPRTSGRDLANKLQHVA
jgi:hypothetical protein